jgi:hypothetical protein
MKSGWYLLVSSSQRRSPREREVPLPVALFDSGKFPDGLAIPPRIRIVTTSGITDAYVAHARLKPFTIRAGQIQYVHAEPGAGNHVNRRRGEARRSHARTSQTSGYARAGRTLSK